MSLNRDFFVAIFFMVLCAILFVATFSLPEPMFDQLASSTWPRMILGPLFLLSLVLMVQSQTQDAVEAPLQAALQWVRENARPWACFGLFFLFLMTLPYLGMLIGGLIYVFLTLCVLGGWERALLVRHALISLIFVVGMWAIFTQALGVLLPSSSLLRML